jgi:acylphosphatase
MIRRVQIVVTGLVQGVYYRYHTKKEADKQGLSGVVRNLPTGQVEIIAEGDEAALHELVEWSRRGPRGADVERLEIDWQEPSREFTGFSVLY